MRTSEAERWRQSSPVTTSSTKAWQISAGLGRKTGSITPRSIAASQAPSTRAKATQEAQARGRGAKPPPRNGIVRRWASAILDLAIGDLRLGLDLLPEPGAEPGELGLGRRLDALALGD